MKIKCVLAALLAVTSYSGHAQSFSDDFARPTNSAAVAPWVVQTGSWVITNGVFLGGTNANDSYGFAYVTNSLTNCTVIAEFQESANAFGYGLGARVNPASGAHYGAWVYPSGSPFTPNRLKLIKFPDWGTSAFSILQDVAITATNFHAITMVLDTNFISVYLNGASQIAFIDTDAPLLSGGVSVDMYTFGSDLYSLTVDNVVASPVNYPPTSARDSFTLRGDLAQAVAAPGVLFNDTDPNNDTLTAALVGGPTNGVLSLSASGSFTYTRTNQFAPYDAFTYRATDGVSTSGVSSVLLTLTAGGHFFSDNFARATNPPSLLPWTNHSGNWVITNGVMAGGSNSLPSYATAFHGDSWTDFAVEGSFLFPPDAYGGGIAGRVNPATGHRYAAWLYPELSDRGPNNLRIVKFQSWDTYGYNGEFNTAAIAEIHLDSAVITNTWHTLKLAFQTNLISVYFDGLWLTNVGDFDIYTNAYPSGGVSLDFFTFTNSYILQADDIVARPLVADDSFVTTEETQLTVATNGVLANDTGMTSAGLTAVLVSGPVNGTLNLTNNGSFAYTPDANFFGTDSFTYEARDGTNRLGAAIVNLTVNPANDPPQLPVTPDYEVVAGDTLTITNTATDQDVPANVLSYSLVGAPNGVSITTNGIISWTPTLAQSASTNLITTVVTDNGVPALSDTNVITVVVTRPAGTYSVATFFENFDGVTAPNLPANWTTSQLDGQLIWFTQTSQRDSLPNAAFSAEPGTNGVNELVTPAINLPAGNFQLHFRNHFNLESHPENNGIAFDGGVLEIKIGAGAFTNILTAGGTFLNGGYTHAIASGFDNPLAGRSAWSGDSGGFISTIVALPTSVSGQTIQLRWRCGTDNATGGSGWAVDNVGVTNLLCCNLFAPVLPGQTDRTISELSLLSVTNTASDGDLPGDNLAYSLVAAPGNATIATNGVIAWTPTEAQGAGNYAFTTVVTDQAGLSYTNTFTVTVDELNVAPSFVDAPTNTSISEFTSLVVTNVASDSDLPVQTLVYSLNNAPVGMVIDANGAITWTPGESAGGTTNAIETVVTDGVVSVTNNFTVIVTEVNAAPVFVATPVEQTIAEGGSLNVTNNATDSDLPVQTLVYSLNDAPVGMAIDANGAITWTPGETAGGTTNAIETVVTDGMVNVTNSLTVIVTEVNAAPVFVATPTEQTLAEGGSLNVTNNATDSDLPVQTLVYSLNDAPIGMAIDSNGAITWTPGESAGGTTNAIETVVTDGVVSVTNSFTVIVTEVNDPPAFVATPVEQTLAEGGSLNVTNNATDSDLPVQTLVYSLNEAPVGMLIDANGAITWTPDESAGGTTNAIETVVTDGVVNVTNSFTVIVTEVNAAPAFVATPVEQALAEGGSLNVTNNATDSDLPVQTLVYSLNDAPVGMAIDSDGAITWTPGESDGGTTNAIETVVTDGVVNVTNSFTVIVTEVNDPPAFVATPSEQTIAEGGSLNVTNNATDSDLPVQTLVYSLNNAPVGMAIDANGAITWTAGESDGGTTNAIETVVADGAVSVTNSFTVIVTEVNAAPAFVATPSEQTLAEGSSLNVTNSATDSDLPVQTLVYSLNNAPVGMAIDSNGAITWTPGESAGGTTNAIETVVTDGVVNVTNLFSFIVTEVNVAPVFVATPVEQTIAEGGSLNVTNNATDSDLPVQTLSYSLNDAPIGMAIDSNGAITWTPGESAGGTTNAIATVVTDGVVSVTNEFTVIVAEVNAAPVFAATPSEQTLAEGDSLNVTNNATDSDLPVQTLAYSLNDAPIGMAIDSNGAITWTPGENAGGTTNLIATVVTDGVVSVTNEFTVIVTEVNAAPAFVATPAEQTIAEGGSLNVTNNATDSDLPVQTLAYSLNDAPVGMAIDADGAITWTPGENAGGTTNTIETVVTDGVVNVTNSFSVIVTEVNAAPAFVATPSEQTIAEGGSLNVTNNATDSDLPVQTLVYSLNDAPVGMAIDANGAITWTPGESAGGTTNAIETVVTDGVVSVTNTFNVIVTEVNVVPAFVATLTEQTLAEGGSLNVTNNATDSDLPVQTLVYSLNNAPGGMAIDANGAITWTPGESDGGTTNAIETVVTDGVVNVTNSFTVIVTEVNAAPQFVATPVEQALAEGGSLNVTNNATDSDLPVQTLVYSLNNAPVGMAIDSNGAITWTAGESDGGTTNAIETVVTDGAVSVTNIFSVMVTEVNAAPAFVATPSEQTLAEGSSLNVTNSATDSDLPVQTLVYSLNNAPVGMAIDSNGAITWTPGESAGGTTNVIETVVTDGVVSVTNEFTVIVTEVNAAPAFVATPSEQTLAEGGALNVTNNAADSDLPVQTLVYSLNDAPVGMAIDGNGAITWTPGESAGGTTNAIETVVTDGVVSVTNTLSVIVTEVNVAPVFVATPAEQTIAEGGLLNVTNNATDSDLPAQMLVYSLNNAPVGMAIDSNGAITWTPGESDGGTTNAIETVVTDGVVSVTNIFNVIVTEVNVAPVFVATPAEQTIAEGSLLNVTNNATDSDLPAQALVYSLNNAPVGMGIDSNGAITWTPGESDGGTTNAIETVVTDGVVSVTNTLSVIVTEVNVAPAFVATPAEQTIAEGSLLNVTNNATDSDLPVQVLVYSLNNAPVGMGIDSNGAITWTPGESAGGTTNAIEAVVTDGVVSVTNIFSVIVTEVNSTPIAANDSFSDFGTNHTVTVSAPGVLVNDTDADVPPNALTAVLVSGPTNGTLTLNSTGGFTYTPDYGFSGVDAFTYRASDGLTNSEPAVVTLTVISHPLVITGIEIAAGVAVVSWDSEAGATYRVQSRTSLTAGDWNDLSANVTATGLSTSATNAVGAEPQVFFRVRLVP